MAEFTKIMEIKKRMCDSYAGGCGDCPLAYKNNGMNMQCVDLFHRHPDKTEKIILKWDEELPVKTRLTDFLEKYPRAKLDSDGMPSSCVYSLGLCDKCEYNCVECWNTPLED